MPSSEPTPLSAGVAPTGSGPTFQTLDAASAIALLDNSTELYLEIARAYKGEIAGLPQRVGQLLQTDLPEATRTLHTLKGLSLTVGANQLSEVCRQCEATLKTLRQSAQAPDAAAQQSMVTALAQATSDTQQALVELLSSSAPTVTEPNASAHADGTSQELVAALRALQALLACSDLQALDDFGTLRARHVGHTEALHGLDQALKAFDFAQGVVQCDELIRRFGATH